MTAAPGSVTERSKLWIGGLGSPSPFTLRLIAECGINAPGVLKGYKALKNTDLVKQTLP